MILNTVVTLVLISLYVIGMIISGIYIGLTKAPGGKFESVPWNKMGTQIGMAFMPVINYFPIREIIKGEYKK